MSSGEDRGLAEARRGGVLTGVRIVEFEAIGPVPLAGMLLADMGAEVMQITRPRHAEAPYDDVGAAILYRGRTQVELDLKHQHQEALDLVARADISIEGLRPGVMERLGLGPAECHAVNPGLVYGRITGWGQSGPLAADVGHDINYLALTGVLAAIGSPDAPPPPPLNLIGDYAGGTMFLVAGVLAALLSARATGQGQVVDAAMTDGVAALSAMFHAFRHSGGWGDAREANLLDGGQPYYRCYTCADGRYVAVGAIEPAFYAALLKGLDLDPQTHRQGDPATGPAFAAIFATRDRDDWAVQFAGTDACVTPVLDWAEAQRHPHNMARATYPASGGVVQPAPAPRFSLTPSSIAPSRALSVGEALGQWTERTRP